MSLRQSVLLLIAFALTLGNAEASDPSQAPSDQLVKLTRAKLDAARRTFEGLWESQNWRRVEVPYTWSRRWLAAQSQLSDNREDRIAGFRDHLERMRELERVTKDEFRDRLSNVDEVHATGYYVAEAAECLARAKAASLGSVTKR